MHRFPPSFLSKACLAVLLVAGGDLIFYQWTLYGAAFGLYGLALLAALVAGSPALRRDGRAWIAVAVAALFALAFIRDPGLIAWSLFWAAAMTAALMPMTARRGSDGWLWFQRLLFQAVRSPVAPVIDLVRLLRVRRRRGRGWAGIRAMLPVVALPVAGSAVILILFAAANPVIEQLLSALALPEISAETVARIVLWIFLFTISWCLLRPRLLKRLLPTFDGRGDLALPGVSVASVRLSLIAFNLLFALQNLLDIAYLWGLVPLPDGMTLADYAHRGAYPLIATALLAALFVLVTLRPGSSTAAIPVIRWLVLLWIGQNIFLVVSSMQRTMDYVEAYSLTELRIAALVWMALVAIGLALICWRLLRDRSASWLINANIAAAGLVLSTSCFMDFGEMAAWWNVRHAREVGGDGVELDLCYLRLQHASALLPLIELEGRHGLKPGFRARVQVVRQNVQDELASQLQRGGWTWLGEQRMIAAKARLAHIRPMRLLSGERDCDGSLIPPPPILVPPAAKPAAAPPARLTRSPAR